MNHGVIPEHTAQDCTQTWERPCRSKKKTGNNSPKRPGNISPELTMTLCPADTRSPADVVGELNWEEQNPQNTIPPSG